MNDPNTAGSDAVENLSTAECWRLVESASFGRLAVEGLDRAPDIFPVNYTVHDGSVYIKSAAGTKLMAIVAHPATAFEVDGQDDAYRWSVVLRGVAHRLALDSEIRESGIHAMVSSTPTPKYNYIGVTPSSVSGRRFLDVSDDSSMPGPDMLKTPTPSHEPTRPYEDTVMREPTEDPASAAPVSIAHFPPL